MYPTTQEVLGNSNQPPFYIPPKTGLGLSEVEKQKHNERVYRAGLTVDKEKEILKNDPITKFIGNFRGFAVSNFVTWANQTINDLSENTEETEPFNFLGNEERVKKWSLSKYNVLSPKNNTDSILEEIEAFSADAKLYLLDSPHYTSYQERLEQVRLDELSKEGNLGSYTLGGTVGLATDIWGFAAAAEATLPWLVGAERIGTGAELVYGRVFGNVWRTSSAAQEAALAAQTASRLGLLSRGAALATAEAVVYELAKAGFDPLDELETSELAHSMVISAALGGGLNSLLGRRILAHEIEAAATRKANLMFAPSKVPGGWSYSWNALPNPGKSRGGYFSILEELQHVFYGTPEQRQAALASLNAVGGFLTPEQLLFKVYEGMSLAGKSIASGGPRTKTVQGIIDFLNKNPQATELPVFRALREIRSRNPSIVVDQTLFNKVLKDTSDLAELVRNASVGGREISDDVVRSGMLTIINNHLPPQAQIRIFEDTLKDINIANFAMSFVTNPVAAPKLMDIPELSTKPKLGVLSEAGITFVSNYLNQAAILLRNKNPAIRAIGFLTKNASRITSRPQGITIIEEGQRRINLALTRTLLASKRSLLQSAESNSQIGFRSRFKLGWKMFNDPEYRENFYKEILKYLDTGDEAGLNPFAVKAAKEITEEFREIARSAFRAKVPGFSSSIINYSPWLWRWDRIRDLGKTENGRKGLKTLLETGFETGANGKRGVSLNNIFYEFDDASAAASVMAERLISLAEYSVGRPLSSVDDDLVDSIKNLASPLKQDVGSPTPFGKSRTLLDRNIEVPMVEDILSLGKNSMNLNDLRNVDLPFILKKYFMSVQGAINEREFIQNFEDLLWRSGVTGVPDDAGNATKIKFNSLEQVRAFLKDTQGQMKHGLGKALENASLEDDAITALFGALKYEPVMAKPGIMDKLLGIGGTISYLKFGGQFALAGVTETGRILGSLGFATTLRQFPVLTEMIKNWRRMNQTNKNAAAMVEALAAPAVGRSLRLDRAYQDSLDQGMDRLSKAGSFAGRISDRYADLTLLPAVTSFSQTWAGAALIQHLSDAAQSGFRMKTAQLNLLGITDQEYDRLIDFVRRKGVSTDGFLGKRVVSLADLDEKDNVLLLQKFMYRFINTKIQSVPSRGDFSDHAFKWLGRSLLQFKTFNIKGLDNFLIANAQRASMGDGFAVAKEYLTVGALSSMVLTLKNYANYKAAEQAGADREQLRALENNLTFEAIAKAVWVGPVETGFTTYLADPLWTTFVDKDPIFGNPYSYGSRQGSAFDILGPGGAVIKNAVDTGSDILGVAKREVFGKKVGKQWTETEQKRLEKTLIPNLIGVKQLYDAYISPEISKQLRLRKEQPRGTGEKKDFDPFTFLNN